MNISYIEDFSLVSRKKEIDIKIARIVKLLNEQSLCALYLTRQSNFSWITAGGSNTVTICTESGVASVLITLDGRKFVVTNRVEEKRLREEQYLEELGFEIISQEWYQNNNVEIITNITGSLDNVGADIHFHSTKMIQDKINPLRYSLTHNEICRYQYLGNEMSQSLEKYLLTVKPGMTEYEIAGGVANALWEKQIEQVLFLVATDERILQHRHPVPTNKRLKRSLMVSCNGRYKGLITTTTRMIYFEVPPQELKDQYQITATIENRMIEATKPGVDELVPHMIGKRSYEEFGFKEMYYLHHQGGAQGYYNRDYLVSDQNHNVTQINQCYCYNPSISGTKTEDAFIATEAGPLMITKPFFFPKLLSQVNGTLFERPGILLND